MQSAIKWHITSTTPSVKKRIVMNESMPVNEKTAPDIASLFFLLFNEKR